MMQLLLDPAALFGEAGEADEAPAPGAEPDDSLGRFLILH